MTIKDKYANVASIVGTVTASTYVFTELLTGISLGAGVGIVIDQIDYYLGASVLDDFDADSEALQVALCTSNTLTNLEVNNKSVIDVLEIQSKYFGTPANGWFTVMPIQHQFFPPIIVAAPRLYLGTYADAGIDGGVKVRIFFRYVKLSSQEYLEIAESFVLVG